MREPLEDLIKRIVKNLDVEKLDKRVDSYVDYKNKYAILRPSVKVEIELTSGQVVKIDVTDYFEREVR